MTKVLLIGSHILGNSTASKRYHEVLSKTPNVQLTYIAVEQTELDQVSLPKKLKKYQSLSTFIVLRDRLKKIKDREFDLIICMTVQPVLALANLFKQAKIACWYDAMPHHPESGFGAFLANKIANFVYNLAFKRIHILLPMSNWAKSQIVDYKFPNLTATFVCPIYVSEATWKRKVPKEISPGQVIRVLMSGNDAKRKGFIDFFSWVKDNQADVSGFEFTILTNEGSPKLIELAKILKIKIIDHLTHNNIDEIVTHYHNSDIFFLPTKSDMMPNVLIEAAAAKLPILAADIGAINELVNHGKTGWLVEKENWPGFYQALINFNQNPLQFSDSALEQHSFKFFDSSLYELLKKVIQHVK